MLGADGPGKAEAEVQAVARSELFCDDWEQASHGGELTGAVAAGLVTRDDVRDLGQVLTGAVPGRSSADGSAQGRTCERRDGQALMEPDARR
jgi:ornithine cyclodeaminase/alanine dehydrogenase-like protein (mu-crystallin family)